MPDDKMPERIKALPVDPVRKIPIPWFVAMINGNPEFRVADERKRIRAVREKRCWVCGDPLGKTFTFVVGPMCGINRTSAEPPNHTDCALYSVHTCPFLTRPRMERREGGLDAIGGGLDAIGVVNPAGHMIKRNPGVILLWTTKKYTLFDDGLGGALFRLGDPINLEWFAEGRAATRAEVAESVRTGLPALESLAQEQDRIERGKGLIRPTSAVEALRKIAAKYVELYPKA